MEQETNVSKEEVAIVLDFLPNGYPFDHKPGQRAQAIVQALGKERFVLLELAPKKDASIQLHQEVYIGEGKRDEIHHIINRIDIQKLTPTATQELEVVLHDLVRKNEARFVRFFNFSAPLSTRMHQLELIPGVGKKHMWELLEKRAEKQFTSFADLKERVRLLPDPEKAIVRRILNEIEGKEKHKLFVES